MTLIRTVAPTAEPVTLAEAKSFLRLSGTSEDDLIAGLIKAAREDVERATGLALMAQSWRLALDAVPQCDMVTIVRTPVQQIVSVTVYAANGSPSVVDPATYKAEIASRPARLLFLQRPQTSRSLNGIEIDFTAGYGEAGTDVPDLLRRAILTLTAYWYEFRNGYAAADQPVAYPPNYERMISSFRAARL